MIKVTKTAFFRAIGPRDITSSVFPDHTAFSRRGERDPIGRIEPGYKGAFGEPKRYLLDEAFLASAKGKKP